MSVYCLQERLFTSAKERVHLQLVDYFVNLDVQRRLWYFTLAIRSNCQAQRYTSVQAGQMVKCLMGYYKISRPNIEFALAFDNSSHPVKPGIAKIVRLKKSCVSEENFDEQLSVLNSLYLEKNLEYRQALELVVTILHYYPKLQKGL